MKLGTSKKRYCWDPLFDSGGVCAMGPPCVHGMYWGYKLKDSRLGLH